MIRLRALTSRRRSTSTLQYVNNFLCVIAASTSFPILAGTYVVKDATVYALANTWGNEEKFTVWLNGGTGSCANKALNFPLAAAGSEKIYNRAYETALLAFASGAKIWAHDFEGDSCDNVSYIRLVK